METQLYQGLTFLSYSTGIIVILVGIMLIKLLFDLSGFAKNLNNTINIVKTELEPALKNLNKSIEIVSSILIKTNTGVQKMKTFLSKPPFKVLGMLTLLTGKATKGFFGGLFTALKLFRKK